MERLRSFEDGLESVIAEGTDEDNEVIRAREMLNNLTSIRASATSQQEQQQQQQNSTLPPTESVIVPSTVREDIEEALLSRTLSRDVSQENEADNIRMQCDCSFIFTGASIYCDSKCIRQIFTDFYGSIGFHCF